MKFAKWQNNVLYPLLLIAVPLLLFAAAMKFGFINNWDDGQYVLQNQHLKLTISNLLYWFREPCVDIYMPLTMMSYMLDYAVSGLSPMMFHLQNLFWHLISVSAVYFCFLKLRIQPGAAFICALAWAVHPQRVESVVWIAERKDVLCGAMFFLAILAYLYKPRGRWFSWSSIILFALAMMAKPMAVSLPLILGVYEFARSKKMKTGYYVARLWPYLLIGGLLMLRIMFFSGQTPFKLPADWLRTAITVLYSLFWYFRQTLLPIDLCPIYPVIKISPLLVVEFGTISLGTLMLAWLVYLKKGKNCLRILMPLVLCFIFALLPVLGSRYNVSDFSDRYTYIPSVFIWLGIAAIYGSIMIKRSLTVNILLAFAAAIYVGLLFFSSYNYLGIWRDERSLFAFAADRSPTSFRAKVYYAMHLLEHNYLDQAVAEVADIEGKCVLVNAQEADFARIARDYVQFLILKKTAAPVRATHLLASFSNWDLLVVKTNIDPDVSRNALAFASGCALQQHDLSAALHWLEKADRFSAGAGQSYFYQGLREYLNRDYRKAVDYFRQAHALLPDDQMISANLKQAIARQTEK